MERILAGGADPSVAVGEQSRQLRQSVGHTTSDSTIDIIVRAATDAKRPQFYAKHETEDFWYEMLVNENLTMEVGKAADAWAEDDANVQKAAGHVQRDITVTGSAMVRNFGYCRFKAAPSNSWYLLEDGPGVDSEQQTMVFIALEELGPHNGFPFRLSRGEHACMDGNTAIWTPPTGGGLAICISLRL